MRVKIYRVMLLLNILAMIWVVAEVLPSEAAVRYSVTDLGLGTAVDINNLGQVVGSLGYVGFFWDSINGRKDNLGFIAYGLNDYGQVVGHSFSGPGFIWNSVTGHKELVPIIPKKISNSELVVGFDAFGPSRVTVWDRVNGIQLPGGGINGHALDVNDYGQVVGSMFPAYGQAGFVWHASNGLQDIGNLGAEPTEAESINNQGQIVGSSRVLTNNTHAFIWDSTDGIRDLGTLYGGGSKAHGINDLGMVVGQSDCPPETPEFLCWKYSPAFVWNAQYGMVDLNDLIPSDSDWILINARAINNKGQIVGTGLLGGVEPFRAFLLTPIAVIEVSIDIRPGDDSNCLKLNGYGVIPVAIFGSKDLDVYDIDIHTLSLQGLSVKLVGKVKKVLASFEDVDGDGHIDLVAKFEDSDAWTGSGEDYATLTGTLYDGTPIEGTDSICIIP